MNALVTYQQKQFLAVRRDDDGDAGQIQTIATALSLQKDSMRMAYERMEVTHFLSNATIRKSLALLRAGCALALYAHYDFENACNIRDFDGQLRFTQCFVSVDRDALVQQWRCNQNRQKQKFLLNELYTTGQSALERARVRGRRLTIWTIT